MSTKPPFQPEPPEQPEQPEELKETLHWPFFAELAEDLSNERIRSEQDSALDIVDNGLGSQNLASYGRPFEIQSTTPGSYDSFDAEGETTLESGLGHGFGPGIASTLEFEGTAGSIYSWYDGRADTMYTLPSGIAYFNQAPPDWVGPANIDFDTTGIIAETPDLFFIIYEIAVPAAEPDTCTSEPPPTPFAPPAASSLPHIRPRLQSRPAYSRVIKDKEKEKEKREKKTGTTKALRGNWCPRLAVGPYLVMEWQSRPCDAVRNADGTLRGLGMDAAAEGKSRTSPTADPSPNPNSNANPRPNSASASTSTSTSISAPAPDTTEPPNVSTAIPGSRPDSPDRSHQWSVHSQTLQRIRADVQWKWERVMMEVKTGSMSSQRGFDKWSRSISGCINSVMKKEMLREREMERLGKEVDWESWFDFEGWEGDGIVG
ncbi:hypothetical protein K491DRAFT_730737 [Lophiostoma macrostomum CBS 122681]|uniref:Uncharacterized protein n=1 Tax=Lophiostoma macrostomum CBS 122681 TaxID=1314788 RepID=A0A6A6SSY7_9PLEO|nr:hypothetical protein K491DRAFT_730737 [Lophiostoma macrostomum CBS 122681]